MQTEKMAGDQQILVKVQTTSTEGRREGAPVMNLPGMRENTKVVGVTGPVSFF